jgi:hypothetical protein
MDGKEKIRRSASPKESSMADFGVARNEGGVWLEDISEMP